MSDQSPQAWTNVWSEADRKLYANCLGNLTLVDHNHLGSISKNDTYDKKIRFYEAEGEAYREYRSSAKGTSDWEQIQQLKVYEKSLPESQIRIWTKDSVRSRDAAIRQQLLDYFKDHVTVAKKYKLEQIPCDILGELSSELTKFRDDKKRDRGPQPGAATPVQRPQAQRVNLDPTLDGSPRTRPMRMHRRDYAGME